MNLLRTTVAGVLAGAALSVPVGVMGAGSAVAAPSEVACRAGDRVPTGDPHEYDSCIQGEWGNLRRCPPFTVVVQAPDGDVRCVPE
ncbi:hypothetical protein GPX89_25200 [Nocardia sp. ET3-3]|uniref:Secreted protein n=1 Tax=Nocardia terrae TaxID=2675851 RepID=A0A7K1V1K7_9NOCA|nr:hypothetical protein [Nocardia terrae]MVU80533.1 hypothetical protein [Nocardia terrae]